MHTKKNASFLIIVVLSMLILSFITFATVYEQILSQSNGFFNVIIFGVALILMFIIITILARIFDVKKEKSEQSPVVSFLIILGIVGIFAAFVFLRLGYTSSISPDESKVYLASEYLSQGILDKGKDVHEDLIGYPADFIYCIIVSPIFKLIGESRESFTLVNICMMLILGLFIFLTVNLLSSKLYAVIAAFVFMFIPNNSFLVYSLNSELFVAAMFSIAFFLYSVMIYKRFLSQTLALFISVLCGIFSGICLSCEPVMFLAFLGLTIWAIKAKRQSTICYILPHIISLAIVLSNVFLKANTLNVDIIEVLLAFLLCFSPVHVREAGTEFSGIDFLNAITGRFNNPSRFLNDNYYFLTNQDGKSYSNNQTVWLGFVDQLATVFAIILCVMLIVYIIRVAYDKILPALTAFVLLFLGQLLGGVNKVGYVYVYVMIFIIGTCSLYYMYLNHHPDYALYVTNKEIRKDHLIMLKLQGEEVYDEEEEKTTKKEDVEPLDEAYLQRARALVFIGEDDSLYDEIKAEEKKNRILNPVAATMIETVIDENGEYDSKEKELDFLDELDEETPKKVVAEVKAIPATRPVEVVKPILADDYGQTLDSAISEERPEPTITETKEPSDIAKILPTPNSVSQNIENSGKIADDDYFDEPDDFSDKNQNSNPQPEGFVFRKKTQSTEASSPAVDTGKASKTKEKPEKVKKEKPEKQKTGGLFVKKKNKPDTADGESVEGKGANPDEVKPGEPLPNPLPLPRPHTPKDLDYDYK